MKSKSYKHEGFQDVVPYLTVRGSQKLLAFLKQAFNAQELSVYVEPDGGRIAHGLLKVGDTMVELSEATDQWPPMPGAIHFYVPDVDATYKRALQAGGTSLQAPTDQFYGERSAAVRDMCGNNWYLATVTEVLTKEEIDKRIEAMATKKS